ncbi:hypothetical protein M3Y99_00931300 [Aphelenchoides fujianensis]|nr:hypothetical protein M3Y99_00931300 [Aphelenchoides fujianensis]
MQSADAKEGGVDDQVDYIEFIKSMDRLKFDEIEAERKRVLEETEETQQKEVNKSGGSSVAFRFLSRKNRDPNEPEAPNERKTSADSTRVKPAIRMKAFKNNRQDTFHSLAMCAEPNAEPSPNVTSSSAASLTEDILRMPYVEGERNASAPQPKQKIYSKVHSEPLLPNTKRTDSKKQLRLHTVQLPNGGVVGYCTEETEDTTVERNLRAAADPLAPACCAPADEHEAHEPKASTSGGDGGGGN